LARICPNFKFLSIETSKSAGKSSKHVLKTIKSLKALEVFLVSKTIEKLQDLREAPSENFGWWLV
jgi:hypothetical protein